MAQTNYTPIQLYYSTTAAAVPVNTNLLNGELAINITDGKLYYKDNSGTVQVIATKGAGTIGGSTTQIQYNNAGALAGSSAMVFNNSTNVVTLTTLNLTNALGAVYGGTGQSTYTTGDLLYSSAANTLSKLAIGTANYILTVNSGGTNVQWSAPSAISVNTATNLAGGVAGSVPYQSGASTTTFLGIGAADRVMTSSGSAPQWVTSLTGLTGVSSSSITNTSLTSGRVVYSGASGVQTDSANLTFNGTTLSAGGFSTTGLSTLVKTVTVGNSNFDGGNAFAPATPAKLYIGTGTVTDMTTPINGNVTTGAITSLAITPIAADKTGVTYTNAATLYIDGAPSNGTNVLITNPYALYIAAGNVYLGGGTANGVAYLNGAKVLATGSALVFDGTNLSLGVSGTGSSRFKWVTDSGVNGRSWGITNGYNNSGDFVILSSSTNNDTLNTQQMQIQRDGTFVWTPAGTEAMRLTSTSLYTASGIYVGIGTSAASGYLNGTAKLVVLGNANSQHSLLVRNDNAGSSASAALALTASGNTWGIECGSSAKNSNALTFQLDYNGGNSTKMTLDASGNLLVGTTSATAGAVFKVTGTTANTISFQVWSTASSTNAAYWTEGASTVNGVATGANAAATMITINKDSGNTRSINAAGTINAAGLDYAEYMEKSGNFVIAKGDICGINANGKLTNVYADAVSFMVKSTNPSYVGGDSWGIDLKGNELEAVRQTVDRIAFAGQVPVNVTGATAGQYIIPVNDNGAIKGEAVNEADMTLSQYMKAVGKVIAIESDGRAKIIVKVA